MNRILELRKQLKMNQTEFGKTIGVKQSTVGAWENEDRPIPDGRIDLICEIHKVNRKWLVDGIGEMFVDDCQKKVPMLTGTELIMAAGGEIFRQLPSEYQQIYLRFLHRLKDNGCDLIDAIKEFPTINGFSIVDNKKEEKTELLERLRINLETL